MTRRLLLLNTDLEIGGTPTVIRELAVRLGDATRAHIEVACLSPWGPMADSIAQAGIPVTALNARRVTDLLVVRRLRSLIRAHRIDTVFSFLVHANAMAAVASLRLRDVRLLQAIQTTQPNPRWHWRAQALAQRAADKIVTPSESVAQAARERAHVSPEKIVIIPNAIDPPASGTGILPVSDTSRTRIRSSETDNAIKVGFIGRLDPIKRIPDLIEAMTHLPGLSLHIFGAGEQRAELEQLIDQLHLSDRVFLRGPTAGPMEAFPQIDLLVLPSAAEGFPLVLIEAMMAGIPIVATDAPGIRDVVRHDQTALLAPVGSPRELARAIGSLASDPSLRSALAERAYRDVMERFTWDKVLPQYRALLEI